MRAAWNSQLPSPGSTKLVFMQFPRVDFGLFFSHKFSNFTPPPPSPPPPTRPWSSYHVSVIPRPVWATESVPTVTQGTCVVPVRKVGIIITSIKA